MALKKAENWVAQIRQSQTADDGRQHGQKTAEPRRERGQIADDVNDDNASRKDHRGYGQYDAIPLLLDILLIHVCPLTSVSVHAWSLYMKYHNILYPFFYHSSSPFHRFFIKVLWTAAKVFKKGAKRLAKKEILCYILGWNAKSGGDADANVTSKRICQD